MPYAADPWPWPEDSALDRARAVAREYRDAVHKLDPELGARMDVRAAKVGQTWLFPQVSQFEENELLTTRQAAEFCHIRPTTLPQWRRRGLVSVTTPDGIRYRPADLLEYQAKGRLRRARPNRVVR